jgi:hypothetical protein
MGKKRFFTDYPQNEKQYDGRWRKVFPVAYDRDKYVTTVDGEQFKLGYLHHGRNGGPKVSDAYAKRHFDCNYVGGNDANN